MWQSLYAVLWKSFFLGKNIFNIYQFGNGTVSKSSWEALSTNGGKNHYTVVSLPSRSRSTNITTKTALKAHADLSQNPEKHNWSGQPLALNEWNHWSFYLCGLFVSEINIFFTTIFYRVSIIFQNWYYM